MKGANRTGRPFTGDYAGELLYSTLLKFGFAQGTFRADPERRPAPGRLPYRQRGALPAAREQAPARRSSRSLPAVPAGRDSP